MHVVGLMSLIIERSTVRINREDLLRYSFAATIVFNGRAEVCTPGIPSHGKR